MGWFDGVKLFFPEIFLRSDQHLAGSGRLPENKTFSLQISLKFSAMILVIELFKISMPGSVGSTVPRISLSLMWLDASLDIPGTHSHQKPAGIACLEAVKTISLNIFSPAPMEVGLG
jgi:hypothetical protein